MAFQDHFSALAETYRAARPSYPPELFAWLGSESRARELAWDVGCGNGQASVLLADRFDDVYATDPSAAQIAAAEPHARVRYAVEQAEQTALENATVDCITVAQAYHWFDHARFCDEVRRAGKPGCLVAVWTYGRTFVSPEVDELFNELHDVLLDGFWPPGREHVLSEYRELPFPFEELAVPSFVMRCDWTLDQYLGYLRSWSACQRMLEATGRDAVSEIAERAGRAWGEPDLVRSARWPLTVRAGRR